MNNNNLLKAIDKLYSLLIKKENLVDINNVLIFSNKGDNLHLR